MNLVETLKNMFVTGSLTPTLALPPQGGGEKERMNEVQSISDPDGWIINAVGRPSSSGQYVSPTSALQIAAVFSCVRLLAETIASLPLMVYRRLPDGGREVARDHWLYTILHDLPNPEMSSFTLRETLLLNLLLRGSGYGIKVFNRGGRVAEIWPTQSQNVQMFRETESGPLLFRVTNNGKSQVFTRDQIWHIPGLSWNGIESLSPIGLARESLGLAMAQEEYGSKLFKQGTFLKGVLEHPGVLSPEARDNLKESWKQSHGGSENAGKTAILEEGMKFNPVSMTNEDAEFIKARMFSIQEIARIFRVPLHMIYHSETQPRANMEQASLEFVEYSLRPWLVRIEQSIFRDLVPEEERNVIFVEFNVEGLLRGAFQERMRGYAVGRQWGWLSANDVRKKENMNPIEGGDDYVVPLNMGPVGGEANAEVA